MIADKKKVHLAMARACLSLGEIARLAEIPLPTVKNVVSGRSTKPETVGKIAKVLGVDVTEILEDYEEET